MMGRTHLQAGAAMGRQSAWADAPGTCAARPAFINRGAPQSCVSSSRTPGKIPIFTPSAGMTPQPTAAFGGVSAAILDMAGAVGGGCFGAFCLVTFWGQNFADLSANNRTYYINMDNMHCFARYFTPKTDDNMMDFFFDEHQLLTLMTACLLMASPPERGGRAGTGKPRYLTYYPKPGYSLEH